jgi:hypothetical protein
MLLLVLVLELVLVLFLIFVLILVLVIIIVLILHRNGIVHDGARIKLLGTLFDPCRLAYLAYTSND